MKLNKIMTISLSLFILVVAAKAKSQVDEFNVLRSYVNAIDENFRVLSTELVEGVEGVRHYKVVFDSLGWRSPNEVSRSIWQHELYIGIPDELRSNKALLIINGGRNDKAFLGKLGFSDEIAQITGSVVAELKMIPNQPIEFFGDGVRRKEDNLIAQSWTHFLRTNDPTWVAQFPMTKASVAALNVVESTVQSITGTQIEGFVVSGASKRGWTAWLVGAVDDRVIGLIPIVIDVLNMVPSMRHHFDVLGFWSDAVHDYEDHGIFELLDTPAIASLARLIDPYYQIEHLTMPKYIINAANDQFFMPDSAQFYRDALQGPTYFRYVPNSGHLVNDWNSIYHLMMFYESVIYETERPQLTWDRPSSQQINFQIQGEADSITLWQIQSEGHRDWRFRSGMERYQPTNIPVVEGKQSYSITIDPAPAGHYKGHFVEVEFAENRLGKFKLSTDVSVVRGEADTKSF